MKTHCFRLRPHQDLKKEILAVADREMIHAGCVVSCVGSLERVHLRFANQTDGAILEGHFEILSLSGTISPGYLHLHLCIADDKGHVSGGHLLEGCLVYTTTEIILGSMLDVTFHRVRDETYGYEELEIKKLKTKN